MGPSATFRVALADRALARPLDAGRAGRRDRRTSSGRLSEKGKSVSLTRFRESRKGDSEASATGLPAEDHELLLERLRAAGAARLGDPRERVARVRAVAHEPAPDDDAGPTATGPAVHVHDPARVDLGVEDVERRHEVRLGRDREVANRSAHVARPGAGRDARTARARPPASGRRRA